MENELKSAIDVELEKVAKNCAKRGGAQGWEAGKREEEST